MTRSSRALLEISMKELRLASKIIKTLVKDRVHYPGRLVADTFTIIGRCGVLLLLYAYVFKLNGGVINGTGFTVVAWSMFFYFTFLVLSLSRIARNIAQDVQTGNIEVLFSKPVSYLLYRAWWQIGAGLYPFLVIASLGILVMGFMVGYPQTMTLSIFVPTLLAVFIGGVVLSLLVYTIVGMLAFWVEDVTPVLWIVDKAVMILGGSYLPVALFPDFMYKLATYSPFGASLFVTHTVYESWQNVWLKLVGIQIIWIIILGIAVTWMFSYAREKVFVNGG